MILSQNLRKGTVFNYKDAPVLVLDYAHIKMARTDATIRVKTKNLLTGVISEATFNSSEKFEESDIENKNLQFLYSDDTTVYFMDPVSYEQVEHPKTYLEDQLVFMTDGDIYQVKIFQDTLIGIEIPKTMQFKVSYTEPGFKGDTSGTTLKNATLENGLEIKVPLFINIGDSIKINTDTLAYKERAK